MAAVHDRGAEPASGLVHVVPPAEQLHERLVDQLLGHVRRAGDEGRGAHEADVVGLVDLVEGHGECWGAVHIVWGARRGRLVPRDLSIFPRLSMVSLAA
jgi:hypothetical protein